VFIGIVRLNEGAQKHRILRHPCNNASGKAIPIPKRYLQHFNWYYKRTGTLWEGRYRATVTDAENYLFGCLRYIEINPVRAGMVAHPRECSWSSYRATTEGKADALVTQHPLYRHQGREEGERQAAYRALVKESLDAQVIERIRECTNKGGALGSGRFHAKVERLAERDASAERRTDEERSKLIESHSIYHFYSGSSCQSCLVSHDATRRHDAVFGTLFPELCTPQLLAAHMKVGYF
jgi:hypothetical protein